MPSLVSSDSSSSLASLISIPLEHSVLVSQEQRGPVSRVATRATGRVSPCISSELDGEELAGSDHHGWSVVSKSGKRVVYFPAGTQRTPLQAARLTNDYSGDAYFVPTPQSAVYQEVDASELTWCAAHQAPSVDAADSEQPLVTGPLVNPTYSPSAVGVPPLDPLSSRSTRSNWYVVCLGILGIVLLYILSLFSGVQSLKVLGPKATLTIPSWSFAHLSGNNAYFHVRTNAYRPRVPKFDLSTHRSPNLMFFMKGKWTLWSGKCRAYSSRWIARS